MELAKSIRVLLRPIRRGLVVPIVRNLVRLRERCECFLRRLRGEELWIRPSIRCQRVHLGRGDGEWCVSPNGLGPSSVVYSFGVGTDISFDLDIIKRFGATVHGFDPTPISREWLAMQTTPENFVFHPIGIAAYDGDASFSLPISHGVSFTFSDRYSGETSRQYTGEVRRLTTILDMLGHDYIDLLKLDVEGTEYDVIPDITALAGRVGQVLVEFHHRFERNSKKVESTQRAIAKLQEAGFRLFDVSPRGLEYAFLGSRR